MQIRKRQEEFLFLSFFVSGQRYISGKMESINEEKICLCALNMIFGYEPRIATALVGNLGSARSVFSLGRDGLREILGPHSRHTGEICDDALEKARKELEEARREGIFFTGRGEPGYPELLMECEDGPAGLYIRGAAPEGCLSGKRDFVSIVGTREISGYGREWCTRIVEALARSGSRPVIVSGLAYGTDITAHLAALGSGLDTIAVMATGADLVYPAPHRRHAKAIAEKPGSALISDYPLHTGAIPVNFVRRNRIIAGLAKATVLIESRLRGGGMITARQAFSYDRELYALPGRAGDPVSEGCNWLLRSGMATPVISEKDLVESLGYVFRQEDRQPEKAAASHYGKSLPEGKVEEIARVLLIIKRRRNISLQEITEETGLAYRTVAEITGLLENDGFIRTDLMQRCSIDRRTI